MSDRDFFREVDEAVRHDRYRQLWDRYALHAMGVAVLIVAAVAGYKGWTYWQERKAQEAGSQFSEALALVGGGGDAAKANEMFARLAEQGPKGYQTLARFQLAAAAANASGALRPAAALASTRMGCAGATSRSRKPTAGNALR